MATKFLTEQDELNANRVDPRLEAEEDAMWEERFARHQMEALAGDTFQPYGSRKGNRAEKGVDY